MQKQQIFDMKQLNWSKQIIFLLSYKCRILQNKDVFIYLYYFIFWSLTFYLLFNVGLLHVCMNKINKVELRFIFTEIHQIQLVLWRSSEKTLNMSNANNVNNVK